MKRIFFLLFNEFDGKLVEVTMGNYNLVPNVYFYTGACIGGLGAIFSPPEGFLTVVFYLNNATCKYYHLQTENNFYFLNNFFFAVLLPISQVGGTKILSKILCTRLIYIVILEISKTFLGWVIISLERRNNHPTSFLKFININK